MSHNKTLFQMIFGLFGFAIFLAGCGLYLRQQAPDTSFIPDPVTTQDEIAATLAMKYSVPVSDLAVIVTQETEEHARGVVRYPDQDEAGMFLATIGLGEWEVVFDGNDAIPCEALEMRNFPESMRYDCVYQGETAPMIRSGEGLIKNFDDCVAAGNPILESYPEQCVHEGTTFVNEAQVEPEIQL